MPGKTQTKGAPPGHAKGRRKRHDSDADSEKKETVSPDVYISQAITFQNGQQWQKAVDSYTKALELKPGDLNCLVSRSKCYLELGDGTKALADADETLATNKNYVKGLLQKAEALYLNSDFEMALVFYHRGNKLRPEVHGFRLGIQKCQEAIDNSIGDTAGIQLKNKGDLEYFYEGQQQQQTTKQKPKAGYSKPGAKKEEEKKVKKQRKKVDAKTAKQLLGELYADREYLENLLEEMEKAERKTQVLDDCKTVAEECLEYLDSRTEFWQQQKPMYSRNRDKDGREKTKQCEGSKSSPMQWIIKQLEEIDQAQEEDRYEDSLKQCKKVMRKIEGWSEDDVPDPERNDAVANLNSQMGNACLELGQYEKALRHHKEDRQIASDNDLKDAKSRSLDNLGRVYARMGKYDKAIEVWEEKLPSSNTPLETTWLNHEIGRCYLEKSKYDTAKDYGERSMSAAQESGDKVWQLNASVLIAQALVKMGELQQGLEQFETSLDLARAQDDDAAETAIKKAMEDVNNKIVKGLKEDEEEQQQDEQQQQQQEDTNSVKDTAQESDTQGQTKAEEDTPTGDTEKDANKDGDQQKQEDEVKDKDEQQKAD